MKYVVLALLLAAVLGLCFLVDRGDAGKVGPGAARRTPPPRYPILSALLLGAVIPCAWYGIAGKAPMFLAGAVLLAGMSLYAISTYRKTGIDYTEDGFTFRAGRQTARFRYAQILGQRVSIARRSVCLVLCTEAGNVVLQNNMQGFTRFLEAAYAGWCRQKGLDPQGQA